MVQFLGCLGNNPVGSGLRAVPPSLERHGGRSLQNSAAKVLPDFEPCRSFAMLRAGCCLLLAFLANGLVLSAAKAAEPKITDRAEFFSKSAVDRAMAKMQDIQRRFKVTVVVETFPSIPENMKAQYKPAEKEKFFRRWAETRAADEGIKGVYVLICRKPGYLQIEPDESVARKAFTLSERNVLVRTATGLMENKQYDAAELEIANTIEFNVEENLGQRRGGGAVTRTKESQPADPGVVEPYGLDLLGSRCAAGFLACQGADSGLSWRQFLWWRDVWRDARRRLWSGRLRSRLRRRWWRWFLQFALGRNIRRGGRQLDVRFVLPWRPSRFIVGRYGCAERWIRIVRSR